MHNSTGTTFGCYIPKIKLKSGCIIAFDIK